MNERQRTSCARIVSMILLGIHHVHEEFHLTHSNLGYKIDAVQHIQMITLSIESEHISFDILLCAQ